MNLAEFTEKWKDIPTKHSDNCEKRDGFDFELCTCGHDELWERRNEDLRMVPTEELEEYRRKMMEKPKDSYETFRNALRVALNKMDDTSMANPDFRADVAVRAFDELLELKAKETLANDELIADEIVRRLNELIEFEDVRILIADLIEARIPCSFPATGHDTIQVVDGEGGHTEVGFLGILNGLVGVIPEGEKQGYGYITAVFDDPDEEGIEHLRTFRRTATGKEVAG